MVLKRTGNYEPNFDNWLLNDFKNKSNKSPLSIHKIVYCVNILKNITNYYCIMKFFQ